MQNKPVSVTCPNCGASDAEFERGMFVCTYCGSKFTTQWLSDDVLQRIEKLEDRMWNAANKYFDYSRDWENDTYSYADEYMDTAERILVLNPYHAYAWVHCMLYEIGEGIKTSNAEKIVKAAENALRFANPEDYKDISSCVDNHIYFLYWDDLLRADSSVRDRLISIAKRLDSYNSRKRL